jgi:hypothetical protein
VAGNPKEIPKPSACGQREGERGALVQTNRQPGRRSVTDKAKDKEDSPGNKGAPYTGTSYISGC